MLPHESWPHYQPTLTNLNQGFGLDGAQVSSPALAAPKFLRVLFRWADGVRAKNKGPWVFSNEKLFWG